jgi:DNA-binding NarL/FixJ family response regulator
VGPEAYVGREREAAILRAMVDDLAQGRGGVILLDGEPGIGKTALLRWGLATADRPGGEIAWAAADQLSQRFPLRVMLDALGIESRSADPRRAGIAAALRGEADQGYSFAEDPIAALTEALLALVERLTAEGPVLFVVDDLHWADEASLLLWRRLARLVHQMPILLAGATRAVPHRDELEQLRREVAERGTVLTVPPLGETAVDALVSTVVGAPSTSALRGTVARAAGNPMWIREILDGVVRGAAGEVPASLHAAVLRRLEFLPAEAAGVLRIAALLGSEFTVTEVAAVLGCAPSELVKPVEQGIAAGVIVTESAARLSFRHPLIREALYEGIPSPLRVALHRQAARALAEAAVPIPVVAGQLILAAGPLDDWALSWLERSAPVLVNQSLDVAVDLLSAADATSTDDPRWEQLNVAMAQALFRFAQRDDGEAAARAVLAHTTDVDRAAEMREMLAFICARTDRAQEALALIGAGLQAPGLSAARRARLEAIHAMVLFTLEGDLAGAELAATRALEIGRAVGDRYASASGLLWLAGVSDHRGDTPGLLARLQEGLTAAGDDPECLLLRLILRYNLVSTLAQADRLDDAERELHAVREIAERTGGGTLHRLGQVTAGLYFSTGRWDDALAEIDGVTDLSSPDLALHVCGIASLIAVHRDERTAAELALKPIEHLSMAIPMHRNNGGSVFGARAMLAERDGQPDKALTVLETLLAPDYMVMTDRFRFLPHLVRLALVAGRLDVARAATQACGEEAAAGGPAAQVAADRCAAMLSGDPEPVLTAARYYAFAGRIPDAAQAWEDAAVILADAGRKDEARAAMDAAIDIYDDLGAVWDVRRADSRLRPYGIRRGVRGPRRRPSSGWEALSPAELRIARLVASGWSNPDIAAELLLSRRTVQSHVSHILAKLGARSRVEIARQFLEHTDPDH